MKKYLELNDIHEAIEASREGGFEAARATLQKLEIGATTIVLSGLWNEVITDLLPSLYNPADFGRNGKIGEVTERVMQWQEAGRRFARWNEFHARKSGRADLGRRTEVKTGCGDWLYSLTSGEWDGIIAEYRHKQTRIRWSTNEFIIDATWEQFLDYLEEYNAKGLATWFKSQVAYNPMLNKAVIRMQEYKTSKKKIAYLQNCPYCE